MCPLKLVSLYNWCWRTERVLFNSNALELSSVTRLGYLLGNFSKHLATINLLKSSTFLVNFCKGVKIIHFSSEIIFGQLL